MKLDETLQANLITLPINPHTKPRMVKSDGWKVAKGIGRPSVVSYYAWKDQIKLLAATARYTPTPCLFLEFIMPMAKSWSKKKKAAMDGKPHQQRPDCDNLIKAFQDALLKEDSHVWFVCARKVWGKEGKIVVAPNLKFFITDEKMQQMSAGEA